jgi:glycosyltransferase involved in cell wall biosynthesis
LNNQLTVIIPTYNRMQTLRLCLQSLENQTTQDFNVIVVDDGSAAEVAGALDEIKRSSPLSLQVLHQKNAGPARARNLALAHISTPFSLLIGDDILPAPDCLEAHLDFHLSHPAIKEIALGWTTWDHVHQHVTPFMKWYEELQFDYQRLSAGLTPTWQHFYTSNLSFKTSLFQDHPFDERFRSAAWEDIELGFRLMTAEQASLTFVKNACATHIHPTTFSQATRRMRTLGRNERFFHSLWPSARPTSVTDTKSKVCRFLGGYPGLLSLLTFSTDLLGNLIKPAKIHAMLLRSHHQRGYLEHDGEGENSHSAQDQVIKS